MAPRKPPASMTARPDRLAKPFELTQMPLKHTTVTSKPAAPQAKHGKPAMGKR